MIVNNFVGLDPVCSSNPVTIIPNSGHFLNWTIEPVSETIMAGNFFSISPLLLLADQYLNPIISSIVTMQVYSSLNCTSPVVTSGFSGNTALTDSNGITSFPSLSIFISGIYYVKASYGSISSTCLNAPLIITSNTPSLLIYNTNPPLTAAAGSFFTPSPILLVKDVYGNPVSSTSILLAAFLDSSCTIQATGSLSNANLTTNNTGFALDTSLFYSTAEAIYLGANVTSTLFNQQLIILLDGISVCSPIRTTIAPGALSTIEWVRDLQPESIAAGSHPTTMPTLIAKDALGNYIPNVGINITFYTSSTCTTQGSNISFSGYYNATNNSGIAVFMNTSIYTTGTYYVKASSNSISSLCSTNAWTIVAGPATRMEFDTLSIPATTEIAGVVFNVQPSFYVYDQYGNLVVGELVSASAYRDDACLNAATGTLFNNNSMTSINGLANFTQLSYSKAETIYIKVQVVEGSQTQECLNTARTVLPNEASSLSFIDLPTRFYSAGSTWSTKPKVVVRDFFQNLASPINVSLSAYLNNNCTTAAQSAALFNNRNVSVSGIAYFNSLYYTVAEQVYILASLDNGIQSCSSNPTTVIAASVYSIDWIIAPVTSTIVAGALISTQPSVILRDVYGNPKPSFPATIDVYSNSACTSAVFNVGNTGNTAISNSLGLAEFTSWQITKAGVYYAKASLGTVSSLCSVSNLTVTFGQASTILFTTQPAGSVVASMPFTTQPTVAVSDGYLNPIPGHSITLSPYINSDCSIEASGYLVNATSITTSSGYASFSLAYYAYETVYLKARADQIGSACSTGFVSVSPGYFTILVAGSGQASFQDGQGALAGFRLPSSIALDSLGNLYVADMGNHAVRKINTTGYVSTLAGLGQAGTLEGIAGSFNHPTHVSISPLTGELAVMDSMNNMIKMVSRDTGFVRVGAGSRTSGSATGSGNLLAAQFWVPFSSCYDKYGNLLVVDQYNHLLRNVSSTSVFVLAGIF